MGLEELITIEKIGLIDSADNTNTFNSCIENNCSRCCSDMKMNMNMEEFSAFCGNKIIPQWQGHRDRLDDIAETDEPGVYYYTAEKRHSGLGIPDPLTKFRGTGKGANRQVNVLLNGPCHNLDENGLCGIYPNRSKACRNYESNWPHCIPEISNLEP